MGEAPDRMVLVETAEDVERLEVPDPDKVAYLTQTTLSVDDANVVIAALRKKFPRSPTRPRTTSATPPRTARRRCASWRRRPTWCSCWAARTARTASGWPRSPASLGPRAHLIDGVAEIRAGVVRRRRRPCSSPPARARRRTSCRSASSTSKDRYGATIQEEWVREENVHFPLPKSLRELLPASASADVEGR